MPYDDLRYHVWIKRFNILIWNLMRYEIEPQKEIWRYNLETFIVMFQNRFYSTKNDLSDDISK